MNDETHCTICGKRLALQVSPAQTVQYDWGTLTYSISESNSTEPTCFGHADAQKRIAVPPAFQDAFSDEELQL